MATKFLGVLLRKVKVGLGRWWGTQRNIKSMKSVVPSENWLFFHKPTQRFIARIWIIYGVLNKVGYKDCHHCLQ